MNAVAVESGRRPRAAVEPTPAPARIALLGTGTVGSAVLERLSAWEGTPHGARLSLMHVANSRVAASGTGLCVRVARSLLAGADGAASGLASADDATAAAPSSEAAAGLHASDLDLVATALRGDGPRIVIDATASDAVAERHAPWLAQGIHVVTACKLGQGTSLAGWRAIRDAAARGGTRYGDSATVGAGLPLLRSIRELREGGDRIHAIAGVLSGSLAWLFNHYDGLRSFSGFVREARDAGYTEPDPRDDLSGEDVRRKLLILARAAGFELESAEVKVASLVPPSLAALSTSDLDAALPQLDAALRDRYATAWKHGEKLRFIARLERAADGAMRARVGLESLAAEHPLAGGAGTDNRLAIWSDRYQVQPLLLQGPGAGAAVTAAGLLDDVLRIARAA